MYGLSSRSKEAIGAAVEDLFDSIALQLIGQIPKLKHKKHLIISSKPNLGLAGLFVQSMGNRSPNVLEQDVLKGMLDSAHGYIESLKSRVKSNVAERIDGLAREMKFKQQKMDESQVQEILNDEMEKAKAHLKMIVEAESTKLRNMGSLMDISRVAASIGDSDPYVFFVVTRDNVTCKECLRLHLNPGGSPKVWKFSELKQGYHKKGEDFPSVFGLHPHCRCTLTYLTKGFGFDKSGKVAYKGPSHDEFEHQRK